MSNGVESSSVATGFDYSTKVDQKTTQDELKNMGNSGKICFWNNIEKQILKRKMKKRKDKLFIF